MKKKHLRNKWFTYKIQKRGAPVNVGYNGCCYVWPARRWHQHIQDAKAGSNRAFHAAIREFGPDAFELIILDEWDSKADALAGEAWNISSDKSHIEFGGYNSTWGEGWIKETHNQRTAAVRPL